MVGADEDSKNPKKIVLYLQDSSGKELHTFTTGANISAEWAVGWLNERDIVVLYGADIGIRAFEVNESKQISNLQFGPDDADLKGKVAERGEWLRAQKYD